MKRKILSLTDRSNDSMNASSITHRRDDRTPSPCPWNLSKHREAAWGAKRGKRAGESGCSGDPFLLKISEALVPESLLELLSFYFHFTFYSTRFSIPSHHPDPLSLSFRPPVFVQASVHTERRKCMRRHVQALRERFAPAIKASR